MFIEKNRSVIHVVHLNMLGVSYLTSVKGEVVIVMMTE